MVRGDGDGGSPVRPFPLTVISLAYSFVYTPDEYKAIPLSTLIRVSYQYSSPAFTHTEHRTCTPTSKTPPSARPAEILRPVSPDTSKLTKA